MWITQEYSRAIEDQIRVAPGQYLWMHRRWKSRPKEEALEQLSAATMSSTDSDDLLSPNAEPVRKESA